MGTLKAGPPDVASIAELAQSSGVRECLQWVVREKQWINEQHLQVCRIAAPTFLEGKRADWMITQFRALGYDAADRSRRQRGGAVRPECPRTVHRADRASGHGARATNAGRHQSAAGRNAARARVYPTTAPDSRPCWP